MVKIDIPKKFSNMLKKEIPNEKISIEDVSYHSADIKSIELSYDLYEYEP